MSTTGDPSATQTVGLARGAPAPPIGGVLLVDPSAAAPEGVLGVVTSSHRLADGTAVLTTRPAALSEAFSAFSASFGGTLAELSSPRGTGARAADAATFTCDSHGTITHTFDVSLSDFDVSGQLEATVIAPFIELSVWAAPRVTLAVTASGSTHCESHFKPITRQLRGPLFISLQPTVTLDADGSVTMTYTWHPFFLYQFSRGQHNDHDTRELINRGTPALSAQVHAKAQVELAVELSVAKRVGIGGSLGPHVDATATARLIPPPAQACLDATAAVHYGLYVFADVFVRHWTFDLATGDFLKRTIFDGCTTTGVGQEEPPKGGGEEHPGGGGGVGGGGGGGSAGVAGPLSGRGSHTCVVVTGGTVKCWGRNDAGQLGDGTETTRPTPVAVSGVATAKAIAAGYYHTCALLLAGVIDCWGDNTAGELGDGTETRRLTPVAVSGITNATAIAAGYAHTCALLASGGVDCWGANSSGQLGDGTETTRVTPVAVSGITTAVAVSAGAFHTCALLANGRVMCWGDNFWGDLGDGTNTERVTPVLVTGITNATAISVGYEHTCALLASGGVDCWGGNQSGEVGNGEETKAFTPVSALGITTAVAVSAGDYNSCAVLSTGSIECWGDNQWGQIGDGTESAFVDQTSPTAVLGISNATSVSSGSGDTCALLSGGSVDCWGSNHLGALGQGTETETNSLTPVPVTGLP